MKNVFKTVFASCLLFLLISCNNGNDKLTVTYKVYGYEGWEVMLNVSVARNSEFEGPKISSNARIDYSGRKYSFAGWTADDLSQANPSTATGTLCSGTVNSDMTVYAVYARADALVTYKYWNGTEWAQLGNVQPVDFDSVFADSMKPEILVVKSAMTSPLHPEFTYDYALRFNGWTDADMSAKTPKDTISTTTPFSEKVTQDMTVYAIYNEIKDFIYVEKGYAKKDSAGTEKLPMDHDFLICDHEVTQAEYTRYKANPSAFCSSGSKSAKVSGISTNGFPVDYVSWYDAVEYCNWLSDHENLTPYYTIYRFKDSDPNNENTQAADTKKWLVTINESANGYRLPMEYEWEYAARGGVKGIGCTYSGSDDINKVAWYYNSNETPHDVKTKVANELGLYDMSGNVWEWCWEWDSNSGMAPVGPVSGSKRIYRGGGWISGINNCMVSNRIGMNPNEYHDFMGFRVARSL